MALRRNGFSQAGTFAALPMAAIFRTADLPAGQVLIKVQGGKANVPWILVLGSGCKGRYPAPWYGAMEEIRSEPIWFVNWPTTIAATGLRIEQTKGGRVYPGSLIVRPGGGLGVFIEGALCLDLQTGRRFRTDARTAVAYAEWVIDVFPPEGQTTLAWCSGPQIVLS